MMISNLRVGLLLGALLSAAIVMTNVVWPSIVGHPSTDSELSETIGWAVVFLLVGSMGYRRVRTISKVPEAAIAGGAIAFMAFGTAMITFFIIDIVFISIVSQQPEKIWLFQHSGYSDMRSYLVHTNLRAFWTALPLITLFGAICGAVGGYVARISGQRKHST